MIPKTDRVAVMSTTTPFHRVFGVIGHWGVYLPLSDGREYGSTFPTWDRAIEYADALANLYLRGAA